jgi:hypothetical protein
MHHSKTPLEKQIPSFSWTLIYEKYYFKNYCLVFKYTENMNYIFRSDTNFVLSFYIAYSNMKECNSTELFNIYLYSSWSFPF